MGDSWALRLTGKIPDRRDQPGSEKVEIARIGKRKVAVVGAKLEGMPGGYQAQIIFHLDAVLDIALIRPEIRAHVDRREDDLRTKGEWLDAVFRKQKIHPQIVHLRVGQRPRPARHPLIEMICLVFELAGIL